jgi:putative transposase
MVKMRKLREGQLSPLPRSLIAFGPLPFCGNPGRKALSEVATAALPDTILNWYRRLVARKFDGSYARRALGRPPIGKEIAELIVRMAKENRSWGCDRIVGALANLGHQVSDQTVG